MKLRFFLIGFLAINAQAQVNHPTPYGMGTPTLQDIWVDPVGGNDAYSGLTRASAVQSVTEAWGRIPQNVNLIATGYRIQLVAGHYTNVPNYWEARHGTFACPVVMQAADGDGTAQIDSMNVYDCRYLYLIGLHLEIGGGDVLHLDTCSNVLVRNCRLVGTGDIFTYNSPQETMKVNQSQYLYVEGSDISGAWGQAVDCVAVQYGHFIGNKIHHTLDWCMYLKGGSAYITVDGNEFFDGGTGGFTAGQGTGFEFMESPWLHYEAEDIKFVNNLVHDTGTAGIGVNGGYNILIAYNTLYKAGTNDHVFEVEHGSRECDGITAACDSNNAAGGWGSSTGDGQFIPSQNVYVYNNLVFNPAGADSDWNQFVINGATTPPPGCNVANPSFADTNVRIRGNLIWNGPPSLGLNGGTGCGPGNPTCNDAQLLDDNAINTVQPQLMDPENGNYQPVAGGNVFGVTTYAVPSFAGGDRAFPPTEPAGNLNNSVPYDYLDAARTQTGPAGAFAGPVNPPPVVSVDFPLTGSVVPFGTTNMLILVGASDSDGVSQVLVYADDVLIGSDDTAPYQITWTNPPVLLHELKAVAIDSLGAAGTSSVVNVRVLPSDHHGVADDFDGDFVSDLAVYWPGGGQWFILRSLTSTLRIDYFGWDAVTPAPADYDGDGLTDLGVYFPDSGTWYISKSSDTSFLEKQWGWDETVPVPGDYDGDGKADIAVFHPATGDWYILQSSDGTLRLQNWGWSTVVPVPADYDGDHKTDIAVYDPASGDWFILQSTDHTLRHVNWGWSTAEPVPADYDGDGRADIAVYHKETGNWYILQSATSTLRLQGWGWSDAAPVPGDYDGDGKADLTVYNQASGNWYILKSSSSALRLMNWGWSAAAPVQNQFHLNAGHL